MRIIFFLVFFGSCFAAKAQGLQQNSQTLLEEKLRALDDTVHSLKRANLDLKSDLQNLQRDHGDLKKDIENYKPVLDNWKLLLFSFGATTLAAFLLTIFNVTIRLNKKVNEKVDEKITSLFTDRRADFLALLKEYDQEQKAKISHKVTMLTHPSGSDTYHYDLFIKHGFTVSPLTNISQLSQAVVADGDCIIINNESGHWTPEEVEQFIESHPNMCFYIGKGQIRTSANASTRFAAANMRTQVVGNFINLLKYHSLNPRN